MKNIYLSEFGADVNNGLSENSAIKSFDKLSDILKGIYEEVTVNLNGDFYFDKPFECAIDHILMKGEGDVENFNRYSPKYYLPISDHSPAYIDIKL